MKRTKLLGFAGLVCFSMTASAQQPATLATDKFPTRVVRIIVPWPAGGGIDAMGRLIASKLSENLGQSVVVDNRVGANGMIGSEGVARAPADGYTLLVDSITTHALNANLFPKIPFNTERDFTQISMLGLLPYVFVGHRSMPDSLDKLIALAKKNPGEISIASFGTGSISHLAAEMFQETAGIKLLHVPYKGGPPAVIGTLSGEAMTHISTVPGVIAYIKDGRLRAYAMATARRSPQLPDVPTMAELLRNKDYDVVTEVAIMAPEGTPTRIVQELHSNIAKILSQPDTQKNLALLGFLDASPLLPAEIAAHYRAQIPKWGRVIKKANLKLD